MIGRKIKRRKDSARWRKRFTVKVHFPFEGYGKPGGEEQEGMSGKGTVSCGRKDTAGRRGGGAMVKGSAGKRIKLLKGKVFCGKEEER
jgi:hypothetical protein